VHRWSILIIAQRDKQSIYYSLSSLYMFRVSTTTFISSTQNCNYSLRYWLYFCTATSLKRGQASLATLEGGSCTKIWPVPEAVVTVLCTPDDWFGWHPKHVEWTWRIINRLLCVASRWTIVNIDLDVIYNQIKAATSLWQNALSSLQMYHIFSGFKYWRNSLKMSVDHRNL